MSRGELRVYLGLAPGVGKTYKMLDEGWRRRERGADVVAGYVETHQRIHTMSQLRDLEVVPRRRYEYRGASFEEMDLEAILARRPEVVLVDELAHTNAPGSTHEKRWQDVEDLLEAGIDVITTLNIQHLESVNDVVEKITGIVQRETVPDFVVRRAQQIELVDITPEALRRRMAHGNIYPPDKVDASLSNFFRSGNLTALRELSLLWLADRVEDSLQGYLESHGITESWETRERLIVAVTGNPADEVLLRRAARIASRNHAQIMAIHVIDSGAMRTRDADTTLARTLISEFEGSFHEVLAEDVADALVAFARAERGTQIILGSTRKRRPWHIPGVIEKVLRQARDLDVHIIAVAAPAVAPRRRRRRRARVSWPTTGAALSVTALALPAVTAAMSQARSALSLSSVFLVYLVVVLALAGWGGVLAGVVAAVAAAGLENYYFVLPLHTRRVARPDDVVASVACTLFAVVASLAMTEFRRRSEDVRRVRAEAELLAEAVATVTASREDLMPLLDTLRSVYDVDMVALMRRVNGQLISELVSGDPAPSTAAPIDFRVDDETVLRLSEVELDNQDRQLVAAFAARLAAALQAQRLMREAQEMKERAENDSLRIGLLRSIVHDLRPALATIERDVESLRGDRSEENVRTRLDSIARESHALARLIANLLDSGRLGAQRVLPQPRRVRLADVVGAVVSSSLARDGVIDVDLPDDLPEVIGDPDLLERVLSNVVANAMAFSSADHPPRITAGRTVREVELLVIDRGPGTRDPRRRLPSTKPEQSAPEGDLGLTVAAGFVRFLGGELRFEDTPGGGLTVAITLPTDEASAPVAAPPD